MTHHQNAPHQRSSMGRPGLEVADILRAHIQAYRHQVGLTAAQDAVVSALLKCRTPTLGGHLEVCTECGHREQSYNSCRHRACPKCQGSAQHDWFEQRKQRLLATHHFHVVFTLPSQLRALTLHHRKLLLALLFSAASSSLALLARDPKYLGAQLGSTAVLHTWTRDLQWHPHIHALVTGGGLSGDGQRWVASPEHFLFPKKRLSALFRSRFVRGLEQLFNEGKLEMAAGLDAKVSRETFESLLDGLKRRPWVVYLKETLAESEKVLGYLSRYIKRVAISNERLRSLHNGLVEFATRDGKTVCITAFEFIRRFLMHVPPHGFVKVRHFGLYSSSNANTRLEAARALLAQAHPREEHSEQVQVPTESCLPTSDAQGEPRQGQDPFEPRECPRCHHTSWQRQPLEMSDSPLFSNAWERAP